MNNEKADAVVPMVPQVGDTWRAPRERFDRMVASGLIDAEGHYLGARR